MVASDLASRPTASEALLEVDTIIAQLGPQRALPIKLTRSVVDDLVQLQGGVATPKDILDLVRVDLAGRLTVETATLPATRGGTTFTLVGKRFSYRAVAAEAALDAPDELTAISVLRVPPHQREQHRFAAVSLPFTADVLLPASVSQTGDKVHSFLSAFSEAKTRVEIDRQSQSATLARFDVWEAYLDLARGLRTERSRIGVLKSIVEREAEGLVECRVDPLLVPEDSLTDSWISYVAPGGQIVPLGVVVDASEQTLQIRPNDELESTANLFGGGLLVRDARQEEASLQRQSAALRMLREHADAEGDLLELLTRPSKIPPARRIRFSSHTKDLHDSNRETIELALGSERLFLVQGPPGTGKTTVIAELISQILDRETESRILLVSQSNVAIDNVLQRLEVLLPEVPAVRLGRSEKIGGDAKHFMLHDRLMFEAQELRNKARSAQHLLRRLASRDIGEIDWLADELRAGNLETADRRVLRDLVTEIVGNEKEMSDQILGLRLSASRNLLAGGESRLADLIQLQESWLLRIQASEELEELLLQNIRVIAGTCVGVVASKPISSSRFEWVIVDEAGRASPPELLVPLVRGRRLILVGDHKQLPPVLDEEVTRQVAEQLGIPKESLARSLFEDLFDSVPAESRTRLRTQFRMHPEIGRLIEHVFYPEGLDHGVGAENRGLGVESWGTALRWLDTADSKFHQERRIGSSFMNPAETRVIELELERTNTKLLKAGRHATVGILTAYLAQKDSLDDMLAAHLRRWTGLEISVLTVDSAQGKEYDLVFYSAVRSNEAGTIGFLRDERRLNVALSRAKHGLTIVGDLRSLVKAGTRFGNNPFAAIHAWFAKSSRHRPIVSQA
jgi:serine/threonine-protein kinase